MTTALEPHPGVGNPEFPWPEDVPESRRTLIAQVLWTIVLDFGGDVQARNASGELREALEHRGIRLSPYQLRKVLRELVERRWKKMLDVGTTETSTYRIQVRWPVENLPANPFATQVPERTATRVRNASSNGTDEVPTSQPMAPDDAEPDDSDDSDGSGGLSRIDKIAMIMSMLGDLLTDEAIDAGNATSETVVRLMHELEEMRGKLKERDMKIRDLTRAVRQLSHQVA